MAKDLEKNNSKLSAQEKKAEKLKAKKEKADAKKAELAKQIEELRVQIADATDEKTKTKLRKQRDELALQRDGITTSKDGMTIPMASKTKRIITSCVSIVLVLALLVTYVATGTVRLGLVSHFGAPQSAFTGMTVTDKDGEKHDIKVATYNYYFAMIYNNLRSQQSSYSQYGVDLEDYNLNVDFDKKFSKQNTTNHDGETITWADYMHDEVFENILSTYTYYYEAVKANDGKKPEITEEQKKELDETLDEYKSTAEGYGYTLSGYLTAAMGKGVNEKLFREEAEIAYIAENYKTELNEKLLDKTYTDADYKAYQKENYDDLATVDIKMFECQNADDAKAFVSALSKDGANFAELASKYSSSDWDKEAYKNPVESTYNNITRSTIKGMGYAVGTADKKENEDDADKYSGLDWLYSKDRKAGDIKQFTTTVVYVVKPVNISSVKPVTVRHILISPFFNADDEDEDKETDAKKATDKQWAAALKQAEKVLAEWKKGKKTADTFGELAKEHTEDSNGDKGGIYENVVPNQMVSTFNDWIFDAKRKVGDTGIVKTEFGYHIIYFESRNEMPVWQYTAQQALASEDGEQEVKKLEESYSIDENWFGSRYFQKDTDIDA